VSDDLVKRLRRAVYEPTLCCEAADEIERLRNGYLKLVSLITDNGCDCVCDPPNGSCFACEAGEIVRNALDAALEDPA
jgi:hypothetical protein